MAKMQSKLLTHAGTLVPMLTPDSGHGRSHRILNLSILLSALLSLQVSAQSEAQDIRRVASFEQWPGVSQLIAYNDRLWFVNSQPYKDSNVADIYSISTDDLSPRYERSLFSQDTGNPVVYNGLLHWPFEDPRRSAGTGEYAVTDGSNWEWRIMQSGSVMHVHAMNVCDNQLVAVTGSWTGQLHVLEPDNQWRVQYDYAAGEAPFSRLVNVGQFNERCVVAAAARGKQEPKLFSLDSAETDSVSGWPNSDRVDGLTIHQDNLFAFADTRDDRSLYRFDGEQTHKISLPQAHRPTALHSDGEHLWLTTRHAMTDGSRGQLWRLNGKNEFDPLAGLAQFPISLTRYGEYIAIGTYDTAGAGLWLYGHGLAGEPVDASSASGVVLSPSTEQGPLDQVKLASLVEELATLIEDPRSTDDYARTLRRQLGRHPDLKTPEFGAAIVQLLKLPLDNSPVQMFGRRTLTRRSLIHWYLINAMAISGHGRIDPAMINADLDSLKKKADANAPKPRQNGKNFDPTIAAIVASGWLQQNDRETVDALMQRLNRESDIASVKADVIGALTAITQQRFAYDTDAWNQWWNQ